MKKALLLILLFNVSFLYSLQPSWPTPQIERKKGDINLNFSFLARFIDGTWKNNTDYCQEIENFIWGTSSNFYSEYNCFNWAISSSIELDYYLSSRMSLRFGVKFESRMTDHFWKNDPGYNARLSSRAYYLIGSFDIMKHLAYWIYGYGLYFGVPLKNTQPVFTATHPSNPDVSNNYKADYLPDFGLRLHIGWRYPIFYGLQKFFNIQRTSYAKVFFEWLITIEVHLTESTDYKNFIVDTDLGRGMGASFKCGISFILD